VAAIVKLFDREVASSHEARAILGLK